MQRSTLAASVLALVLALSACDSGGACDPPDGIPTTSIPQAVRTAFEARYPSVTGAEWYRENGDYEASFTTAGHKTSVLITPEGTVTAIEAEIDPADLPEAVRQRVTADYAAYRLTAAARIDELVTEETKWEAELERNGQRTDYIFAADGALLDTIPLETGTCE